MTAETKAKLQDLLNADNPSNYECADDAIESIADELELDVSEHSDVCDEIEQWFAKGD